MKRKYLIIGLFLSLLFTGCSDWLDVNHNPNGVEQVPSADVLLPAAEMGVANNLMGWDFGFGGGFWVEYWTQAYTASQFKSLCEYQPQTFGTAYTSLMAEALPDLKRMKEMTAEDANRGYYFVAEALSIFAWQMVTDVWGDMPYFEALRADENILSPKQNTQEEIYTDLLKRINDLLAVDLTGSYINGDQDLVYKGNLGKWYIFARSLKLKLMLRLSEVPGYNNAAVLAFIEGGDMLKESAKISGKIWDDNMNGKRHPMRAFQNTPNGSANYIGTNVRACKNFIDYLSIKGDPRRPKLFSGGTPAFRGAFFGDFDSKEASDGSITDHTAVFANIVIPADLDLMIMSAWEVNFYIAEVYARAGNHAKAQEYYEAGVKASLDQHGITSYSIIEPTGYAEWVDGSIEEEIEQIAQQRWIAHCNYQHMESFLERNRTKYPRVNEIDIKANRKEAWTNFPAVAGQLTISVNGRVLLGGQLPASAMYPDAYIFRNINRPDQKPNVGQKVWWNRKAGK